MTMMTTMMMAFVEGCESDVKDDGRYQLMFIFLTTNKSQVHTSPLVHHGCISGTEHTLQCMQIDMWVVLKIRVPFWVLNIMRHLPFRVPKRGTIIFATTHVFLQGSWFRGSCADRILQHQLLSSRAPRKRRSAQ